MKRQWFDRENCGALQNKVDHCGKMPGVRKCKHSISYLFTLWGFHPSSASLASPFPPTRASPPTPTLLMCTFSLLLFRLCVWGFSLSHPLGFLARILFASICRVSQVWESWDWAGRRVTSPNKTIERGIQHSFQQWSTGRNKKWGRGAAGCIIREAHLVLPPWACSPADWFKL